MPGVLSTLTAVIKEQQVPRKKSPWKTMMIPFEKLRPKLMGKEDRLSFKLRSNPK